MYGWILCALKSIHATSPSLAGQTVVKTGSSPDSASSLVRSSQFLSDIIRLARHYSGGTVSASHRSSLLSLYRHLFSYSVVLMISLYKASVNDKMIVPSA